MESPFAVNTKKKTSKPVSHRPLSHGQLAGIVFGVLFVIIIVAILGFLRHRKQKKVKEEQTQKIHIGQPLSQGP
jgi:cell division protein FtsN